MSQQNIKLHILKIGSESFAKREGLKIQVQTQFLDQVARNIALLRKRKQAFVIVSSGAVQMGRKSFEEDGIDWTSVSKQTLAAEGNVSLISNWHQVFESYGIKIAQILLNSEVHNGNYIQHAQQLIKAGRVIIFNENAVVATRDREIIIIAKDNDTFAGQIAKDLDAEKLGIFSSINGYIQNHGTKTAQLLKEISNEKLTQLIAFENQITGIKSEAGTGGIITKLEGIGIHLSQSGFREAQIIDSANKLNVQDYFDGIHKGTLFIK
jgi:glutamate 5-kinase